MSKLVKIRKGAVLSYIKNGNATVETTDNEQIFNYLKIDRYPSYHHIYLNSQDYISIFPHFYEIIR